MITKSNYVEFIGCPRALWYTKYHKDEAKEIDEVAQKRIDEGNLVNQFASRIFENTVSVKKDPNCVNIQLQTEITQKLLKSDCSAIAEASFIVEDLFCAVDILKRNDDGSFDIYEVKASTHIKNHLKDYYPDVAFQKYVVEKSGLKVKKCHLLHLNKEYIRNGEIEPNKLLIPYDIEEDEDFKIYFDNIELELSAIRATIAKKDVVPAYGHCGKDCPYYEYCHKNLAKPNLLELNNFKVKKAHECFDKGIVTLADAIKNNVKLSPQQRIQANVTLGVTPSPWINMTLLKQFLNDLKYPIYHLDFETMNEAIPPFDGSCPYQQIPFQYSLHIEHTPGGKLEHKEFLATKIDSEYELAKQLCNDIPLHATSMAFNMTFERTVLKHLAERFPDLADHLNDIRNNMVDLLEPFKLAMYYDIKQHGSNSIKVVMPSLVPEMEEAYHQLPVVHNGGEALSMFPKMVKMDDGEEKTRIRKGMLSYCELDTLSMVKVLNKLWDEMKSQEK